MTGNSYTPQQQIDAKRPHELLTLNPQYAGQLVYRYTDTGETIRVPNVWYNQTEAYRLKCTEAGAAFFRRRASEVRRAPDKRLSEAANRQIADRYLARAEQIERQSGLSE